MILIRANGEVLNFDTGATGRPSLDVMQQAVGGHIQIITLRRESGAPSDCPDICMVMNEEGKLAGLSLNETATLMALPSLFAGDYIAGDVLVGTAPECGFGDDVEEDA